MNIAFQPSPKTGPETTVIRRKQMANFSTVILVARGPKNIISKVTKEKRFGPRI